MVRCDRFFFALFSLFRFSLSIGLLERPLVIGLFWGIFTGDYTTSLYIAIFFELFWLDLIPVGTFIPPHLTAATFAALSLTTFLGFEEPNRIMVILFACMPLAWLGAQMEGMVREQERVGYNQLLRWTRSPDSESRPMTLVLRSLARTFLIGFVLFYIAMLVLKFTFQLLLETFPELLSSLDVTWSHLWVMATIGGLMALRLKRAYVVLLLGVASIAFFLFVGPF